jgi:hypothetical protein
MQGTVPTKPTAYGRPRIDVSSAAIRQSISGVSLQLPCLAKLDSKIVNKRATRRGKKDEPWQRKMTSILHSPTSTCTRVGLGMQCTQRWRTQLISDKQKKVPRLRRSPACQDEDLLAPKEKHVERHPCLPSWLAQSHIYECLYIRGVVKPGTTGTCLAPQVTCAQRRANQPANFGVLPKQEPRTRHGPRKAH